LKKKSILLGLFTALLVFQLIQFSKGLMLINRSSDFLLEINEGMGVGFQGDNSLIMEVKSGLLNGSSCSLALYDRRGSFSFTAMDLSIIEITSDAEEGYDITITGVNNQTETEAFVWSVGINTGNDVTIQWSWRIESWTGKYTMLALGFGGLILMVASPTWVAYEIRKKGLDADSIERGAYGMLLFCVGFGLMVMWLWA